MNKETQELVKLLNGSLKKMPDFLQHTLVQYQHQQVFYGVTALTIAVIFGVVICLLVKKHLKFSADYDNEPYEAREFWDGTVMWFYLILGAVFIFCVIVSIGEFGHAISPVTSFIKAVTEQ